MISKSSRFNRYNSVAATDRMTMECTDVQIESIEHPAPSNSSSFIPRLTPTYLMPSFPDPPALTDNNNTDEWCNKSIEEALTLPATVYIILYIILLHYVSLQLCEATGLACLGAGCGVLTTPLQICINATNLKGWIGTEICWAWCYKEVALSWLTAAHGYRCLSSRQHVWSHRRRSSFIAMQKK